MAVILAIAIGIVSAAGGLAGTSSLAATAESGKLPDMAAPPPPPDDPVDIIGGPLPRDPDGLLGHIENRDWPSKTTAFVLEMAGNTAAGENYQEMIPVIGRTALEIALMVFCPGLYPVPMAQFPR